MGREGGGGYNGFIKHLKNFLSSWNVSDMYQGWCDMPKNAFVLSFLSQLPL